MLAKQKQPTLKQLKLVGVVTPGNKKIHGSTWSTSPAFCNVGGKLINKPGSVCHKCYAVKMGKVYPSADKSWTNNLMLFRRAVLDDTVIDWCESVAAQIIRISANKTKKGLKGANFHRWFSAGDIDSITMLRAIIKVCELTPSINHWLPTREKGILSEYLNHTLEPLPVNLNIRLSGAMIDGSIPATHSAVTSSTVHTKGKAKGIECPSYKPANKGSCGDCSMCWNKKIENISYLKH